MYMSKFFISYKYSNAYMQNYCLWISNLKPIDDRINMYVYIESSKTSDEIFEWWVIYIYRKLIYDIGSSKIHEWH